MTPTDGPIVALDIDGVMNSRKTFEESSRRSKKFPREIHDHFGLSMSTLSWSMEACAALIKIVTETGAKIVVSSTWRHDFNHVSACLQSIVPSFFLERRGGFDCSLKPIGKTPQIHPGCRGDEIDSWLSVNAKPNTPFVIIDDDGDMLEKQKPFFVQTDGRVGLTMADADKAIAILKAERLA